MKKIILIITAIGLSIPGFSQEKYLTAARTALTKSNDLDEAKEDIDKAMASPGMQENPKALLTKGEIYIGLMGVEKYKPSHPYREGAQALIKLAELKPDYEKDETDIVLLTSAGLYYNDAITAYSNKGDTGRYAVSADLFKNVLRIRDLNGGKRYDRFPAMAMQRIDTVVAKTKMYLALCNYFTGKYADAVPLLVAAKDNPITKPTTNATYLYENLIDAYEKLKESDKELATIQEARAAFPDNTGLRNDELNYYMVTGKQDELVKKLEVEAAKDPTNAEMQFNIAIVYTGLANPKTGKKPDNRAELIAKAEDAFLKSVKIAPENPDYNYNLGGFYNNQAKEINDQMNAITGTSAAEQKKYDDLKVKRDALFEKALPYIEKAYNAYDAKAGSLKPAEKSAYSGSIQVLMQIYSIQSKMDKVDVLKKKINAIK